MIRKFFWIVGSCMFAVLAVLAIEEMSSVLKTGDVAPDFSVRTHSGSVIHLADVRGKKNVLLYFYPKDFTRNCIDQACGFRDRARMFDEREIILIGISDDDSISHKRFAREYGLPFQLVSDRERHLSRAYGANWFFGLFPFTKRITYLIDKGGVIRMASHHELNVEEQFSDVEEAMKTIH